MRNGRLPTGIVMMICKKAFNSRGPPLPYRPYQKIPSQQNVEAEFFALKIQNLSLFISAS